VDVIKGGGEIPIVLYIIDLEEDVWWDARMSVTRLDLWQLKLTRLAA
jgi:hypothetical protein